jgi:hypothetical protein
MEKFRAQPMAERDAERDSFSEEGYSEASPSLLYEVMAAWNLTAANAPKNLVCVTGGIRSAILSQPTRRCWNWNPGVA